MRKRRLRMIFIIVVQSLNRVRLFWDPIDCSTPGFPVLHYLPEFAQIHVHWVSDAIQSSHPLSPSSFAFNLSQHQGLFQRVFASGGQSIRVSASEAMMICGIPMSNSNNNLQGAIKLLLSVLLICSSGSLVVFSKGHKADGLPRWFTGKESACQCTSLIPGLGRYPGRGNGNPLQYPCLGNPMDRGAWWGVMEESMRSQRVRNNRETEHTRMKLLMKCPKLTGGGAWLWPHIRCLPPELSPSALRLTAAREGWSQPHRTLRAGWSQECKRLVTTSPKYLSMSPGPSPNSTLISLNHEAPRSYWRPGNSWYSRNQQSQTSHWFHARRKAQTTHSAHLRIRCCGPPDHRSYQCASISSLLSHPVSSQFGQESYLYLWRLILF